jgi:hypothetical protein
MKRLASALVGSFVYCCAIAQGFSGTIEFRYSTQKDTTLNLYSVKNNRVRLDQYSKRDKGIEGSFLFDLSAKEVKFLNPKRKLWGYQKNEAPQIVRGECTISKGSESRTIAGQKCTDYSVKNVSANTIITYWLADNQFNFFQPLVKLWNRKDKQSLYFGKLTELGEGAMPMLSEEKQISDGKLLTRLEVTRITNTPPADTTLDVPAGYSKFDQQ